MKHTFFLAPVGRGIGLTTVSLGVVRALDRKGVRVGFFKPISQQEPLERSTHFVAAITTLEPSTPIPLAEATRMVAATRPTKRCSEALM